MKPLALLVVAALAANAAAADKKAATSKSSTAKAAASKDAKKAAAPAPAKYPKPPLPVYKGAQYVKKASLSHKEDRDAAEAWAFAVKGSHGAISKYYKTFLVDKVVAESEAKGLYLAIHRSGELRVQQGKDGWVWILMANKAMPEARGGDRSAAGEPEGQGSDGYYGEGGYQDNPAKDYPSGEEGEGEDDPDREAAEAAIRAMKSGPGAADYESEARQRGKRQQEPETERPPDAEPIGAPR